MNKRSKIRSSAIAALLALGLAGGAMADGHRHGDRGHRDDGQRHGQRFDRDHDRRGHWDGRHDSHRRDAHQHREWRRGGYLPHGGHYGEVRDWRTRRLQAPPSGYHWVSANGDLVLAAIATGLIAQIIASN